MSIKPRLCNQRLDKVNVQLVDSFGPFAAVGDGEFMFETRSLDVPIWLGYNASPLFGLAHWEDVWAGEESAELARLRASYAWLTARIKRSPAGQIQVKPADDLNAAELIYNYISFSVLDQFASAHQSVSDSIEQEMRSLSEEFRDVLSDCQANGASFQFEFTIKDLKLARLFRQRAALAGILIDVATDDVEQFKFQLSLACRGPANTLFWQRLRLALASLDQAQVDFDAPPVSIPDDLSERQAFHRSVVVAKASGQLPEAYSSLPFLQRQLDSLDSLEEGLKCVIVNRSNYAEYRQQILDMQIKVYEPVRRTPAEEFDMLFESDKPLAIVVLQRESIVAMAFAGRLGLFRQERGVSGDPFVDEASAYYSVDLTVVPEFRGGLGRRMKQAMVLLAIENGVTAIHGRNRDRLAAGMWAINISLGSYQLQNLVDDYPDEGEFRDCIYYRSPLVWSGKYSKVDVEHIEDVLVARCNGRR